MIVCRMEQKQKSQTPKYESDAELSIVMLNISPKEHIGTLSNVPARKCSPGEGLEN